MKSEIKRKDFSRIPPPASLVPLPFQGRLILIVLTVTSYSLVSVRLFCTGQGVDNGYQELQQNDSIIAADLAVGIAVRILLLGASQCDNVCHCLVQQNRIGNVYTVIVNQSKQIHLEDYKK